VFWRPYGDVIEWRAALDPIPFVGYERIFSWHVADSLAHAGFDLCHSLSSFDARRFPKISVVRQEGGRRRPRLAGFAETAGSICEDGLELEFGGACPIQGQGTLDGCICYYRARGSGWSFEVWPAGIAWGECGGLPDVEPSYSTEVSCYAWPDGGWIHRDESLINLRDMMDHYRGRKLEID
jgi:hypothetical protein